ncbi:hypothetical protein [Cylindrospermum sp. FACHB-282]|uniref:hypothetical protein n=1 Tax=Cylindrospermum sp. FACHB-282 TaxID=2692794 RepID=UPI0016858460|nr:hypothetical protein [Cylindrospermum sp. FACHB-282]MBD2388448.1 hypothetical protein [Cylindrospermum sp. FACHB-282]
MTMNRGDRTSPQKGDRFLSDGKIHLSLPTKDYSHSTADGCAIALHPRNAIASS